MKTILTMDETAMNNRLRTVLVVCALLLFCMGYVQMQREPPRAYDASVGNVLLNDKMKQKCDEFLQKEVKFRYFTAQDACMNIRYACMKTVAGKWYFADPESWEDNCDYKYSTDFCVMSDPMLISHRMCTNERHKNLNPTSFRKFIRATATNVLTGEKEVRLLDGIDAVNFQKIFILQSEGHLPCVNSMYMPVAYNSTYC